MAHRQDKLPVILVFGGRGTGKTSFLNHLTEHNDGLRIYFIVNDEVGIDADRISESTDDGQVIALKNGCVCHVLQGEFQGALRGLVTSGAQYDLVVAEMMGGEADPIPILHNFMVDGDIRDNFEVDGVITIINAREHLAQRRARPEQFDRQVAMADVVLVNYIDLLPQLDELLGLIQHLNGAAAVHQTVKSVIELSSLRGLRRSISGVLPIHHDHTHDHSGCHHDEGHCHHDHEHHHHDTVFTPVLEKRVEGAMDWERFVTFMTALTSMIGPDRQRVERTKFELSVAGVPHRVFIDSVGEMTFPAKAGRPWQADETRDSSMFIEGHRDIVDAESVRAGFKACLVPD